MNYYPITLHIHSVWERNASMEGHFYNAQKLGLHHMYITDHDNRMGRRFNHIDHFDFSQGKLKIEEPSSDPLRPIWNGFSVQQQDDGTSATVSEGALRLRAKGNGEEWATITVEFDSSQKRHEAALLSKVMLYLGLNISAQDLDMRAEIDVKLSQRPPEFEFGHIRYVFGNSEGMESDCAVLIPMKHSGDFARYALDLLQDATDIGGGDNVLNTISFSVSARNGKQAELALNELKIDSSLSFDEGRKEQQKLANMLGEKYGIKPIVTSEISAAGPHKICFSSRVPIIDYAAKGYNVSDSDAVEHIFLHQGLYSRNHPFEGIKDFLLNCSSEEKEERMQAVIDDFINNRAWKASMLEVGFPKGRGKSTLQDHLRLWDALSSAGIFISGYGDSDNHSNDKNWFEGNNFIAYIAANEPSEEAFIEGMLSGNLYTGDPVYLQKVQFSFESSEGKNMGQISLSNEPGEAILRLSGLPENCRVEWVANGKKVQTDQCNGSYYGSCAIPTTDPINFVRAEVYYKERCILLSNPIYHLKDAIGCKGKILFHIGDISRQRYAEMMGLIYRIRPDILIHTGDLVDDLKVGRLEEDIPAYKEWLPDVIHWLEKAAPEVYIVPGNNDLPELIEQTVQTAQLIPPNSILKIDGRAILCCHRVLDLEGEAEIYLYGHGPTYDNFSFKEGEKTYANVIYGPTVVSLADGHCFRLEKFRLIF